MKKKGNKQVADGFYIKALGVLRPADEETEEQLKAIPHGARVRAKITRARSIPHHRLFFGLLQRVYKESPAGEMFSSVDTFRDAVSIEIGHCETYKTFSGEIVQKPKSWKFSKVDQDKFNELFNKAVAVIDAAGFVDEPDLRREWESMLGGQAA